MIEARKTPGHCVVDAPPESLRGCTALVAGGAAGPVGEGLTRAFLRCGARVVVPSPEEERLERLRRVCEEEAGAHGGEGGRVLTACENVGEPAGAERVLDRIQEQFGPLDAVAAALGPWWQGAPLTEVTMGTWRRALESHLTAHFVCARTFLPAIAGRRSASYTLLSGLPAETPAPEAGPMSVTASGKLMIARVLMAEHATDLVRVNALLLGPVRAPGDSPEEGEGRAPTGRAEGTLMLGDRADDVLTTQDVGELAALLASEAGSGVEGSVLRFEGRADLKEWLGTDQQRS